MSFRHEDRSGFRRERPLSPPDASDSPGERRVERTLHNRRHVPLEDPVMRSVALVALAAMTLTVGCDTGTSPSGFGRTYALARIGDDHLPVGQGAGGTAPFLVGDTLELEQDRSRNDWEGTLRWIRVLRDDQGVPSRSETNHNYSLHDAVLTYDSCPREALCIASLVYAPLIFQVVGDSLYQILPDDQADSRAVYGRVLR